MNWTIDQILAATGGRLLDKAPLGTCTGIGIDSRTLSPGFLYVAIRGSNHDGHRFIPAALAKGAFGVVTEESAVLRLDRQAFHDTGAACVVVTDTTRALGALAHWQRMQSRIPVVAVTGSNGKTTTRQMTANVMATRFNTLSTRGNLNNEIGLPLTLFNLSPAHQAAVLELGMNHAGEISRLGAICHPTIGVITNVGPAHLEFLGSLDGVAQAKAELIDQVDTRGILILNADDSRVGAMATKAGGRRVIFFGHAARSRVRAVDVGETPSGHRFQLVMADQRVQVELPAKGRFMVTNALAAAAVGLALGIDIDAVKTGLEKFQQLKGRMSVVQALNGAMVIDDTYNANPASMIAAIDTLMSLQLPGPSMVVVGDMLELGEQASDQHRKLGERVAARGITRLYACGQFAAEVARGALKAGMAPNQVFTGTKEEISQDIVKRLTPDTRVLVKGSRGMAMETVVKAITEPRDRVQDMNEGAE